MTAARPNLPEALNHHPLFKQFISGREDATGRLGIRAARYEKQAHQLLAGGTREELEGAAHLFGMLNQGSINESFSQGIHESYNGLAYTMRLWPSADPDETIELAAMVLEHSASELEDRDELRLAAIARTNRAVLFLEKRQLAADDWQRAQSDIDFSFKHKRRGTLDWSYSLHALALLRFQLPYDAERRVPELIAAKKLFRKGQSEVWDDLSDHQALTAVSQVALAEVRIVQALRTQAELRSITAHARELPTHLQAAALKTPADLGGLMVSNPQALGLHATPDWFGKDLISQQAEQSRRGEAVRCSRELADELQINPTQSAAREHAESNLTLLNWLLEPTAETYAARTRALGIAATTHYPAEYFRKGVQILFDGYSELGIEPPREILRNLADAYLRVLRERQQSRIEAFVEQNPNQIRFVACWLAETAQWHESFDLLELTRGILTAPDPTSSPPTARAHAIHVTHSPKSTYVVVRHPDGTFDGRLLPDLAGPVLSRLWSDLFENVPPILVTPTSSGDRNRYTALNTATVKLGQIVDAVHELVPDDEPIVLCPGGLYSYLPVPAMIACARTGETPRPVICSVTASRVMLENTTNRQLPSLVTLDASHTSPESALPFAAAEIQTIGRSFPAFRTTPKPATIENCVSTFRRNGIAHYSGHSAAHPADPRQSVLLLEDGTLSANQILSAAPLQSDLVVLSSCESGLATTATLSDEYLSIQTALLNGGCTRSIGTLWRVSDVSAGVFFAHFYGLLSSAEEFTTSSICRTMISSQQWLRHATTGEVVALLDAMGIEQSLLPDHPVFRDPTARPFEHIVHWGPYYLVSTSL